MTGEDLLRKFEEYSKIAPRNLGKAVALQQKFGSLLQLCDGGEKYHFEPRIVVVQLSRDFSKIRVLNQHEKWRRWVSIDIAEDVVQAVLDKRAARRNSNVSRYHAANEVAELILGITDVDSKVWDDDWRLVEIPADSIKHLANWRGVLRFALHDITQPVRRARRWSNERLERLFSQGLIAYTVRVNTTRQHLRIEYAAIGKRRSPRSEWVAYTQLHEVVVAMDAKAMAGHWRDDELAELNGTKPVTVIPAQAYPPPNPLTVSIEQDFDRGIVGEIVHKIG